ncbi:hypothetical protein LOTGIDRAFT_102725 [Lottia gigantea]|uniref:Reverse transcriptase domain-containing protein n=1 Tax=Lottia gigantea TaxID=225164 RepID=V4BHQ5_LOTGI|nr:hypothetical protein LOTGIDRAFT_102725 [Lottia gigantea]ESP05387.1 hypothetical protein LOTGIDRAFT_102725 [Lottia gigantea]
MKPGTSPGPDEMGIDLLRSCPEILSSTLGLLFNEIFESGSYPTMWTKALIVPLLKKGSKAVPNSYRGISLLDCLGKLYSTILNEHLKRIVRFE